jgi:hypothetical protein
VAHVVSNVSRAMGLAKVSIRLSIWIFLYKAPLCGDWTNGVFAPGPVEKLEVDCAPACIFPAPCRCLVWTILSFPWGWRIKQWSLRCVNWVPKTWRTH